MRELVSRSLAALCCVCQWPARATAVPGARAGAGAEEAGAVDAPDKVPTLSRIRSEGVLTSVDAVRAGLGTKQRGLVAG